MLGIVNTDLNEHHLRLLNSRPKVSRSFVRRFSFSSYEGFPFPRTKFFLFLTRRFLVPSYEGLLFHRTMLPATFSDGLLVQARFMNRPYGLRGWRDCWYDRDRRGFAQQFAQVLLYPVLDKYSPVGAVVLFLCDGFS